MKTVILITLSVLLAICAIAQDEVVTKFKSLEEALEHPNDVIELTLKRERIREWPDAELRQFPNLKKLDLTSNKIDSLPSDLTYLQGLESLTLTNNRLDSLQSSIGDLKSLRVLNLGNNEIYHVTPRLGELTELRVLELWSNNIYYLPIELNNLKNLRDLDLRNIQLNDEHQDAIKAIFDEPGPSIKMSMSCNCN
ncbi:MAG: leucine-rich repeat domain-containing protein [Flavobacteriales bacterium]